MSEYFHSVTTDSNLLEFELRASMPSVTTSATTGLPKLATTSSTLDYTTPSVGVPSGVHNPYIATSTRPSGTVFIAVGCLVGLILLGFVAFHLFKSITASSTAKKAVDFEKLAHNQHAQNNTNAYGKEGSDNSIFNNTQYHGAGAGAVTKLPLLSSRSSMFGGNPDLSSTSYSDVAPVSKHDATTMFVSPTKEMTLARSGGHGVSGSASNFGFGGQSGSEVNVSPIASNRQSQVMPSLYIDDQLANSDHTVNNKGVASPQARADGGKRKTIPSMYLDDLLDL